MKMNGNLVNQFIEQEFNSFRDAINAGRLTPALGSQSLAMAWMSYYYLDEIDSKLGYEIESYALQLHKHPNYNHQLWIYTPALDATAWLLKRNESILDQLLYRIAAADSSHRLFMQEAVATLAPLVSCDHKVLKDALLHNFIYKHFYREHSLLIYLATMGSKENLLQYVEHVSFGDTNQDVLDVIKQFQSRGRTMSSTFFMRSHAESLLYAMNSIINMASDRSNDLFSRTPVEWITILGKMRDHPLG